MIQLTLSTAIYAPFRASLVSSTKCGTVLPAMSERFPFEIKGKSVHI